MRKLVIPTDSDHTVLYSPPRTSTSSYFCGHGFSESMKLVLIGYMGFYIGKWTQDQNTFKVVGSPDSTFLLSLGFSRLVVSFLAMGQNGFIY
ncbi:hypothetical protein STEG23_006462 [Scotinomys teguina]